jgi:hypothetical protein
VFDDDDAPRPKPELKHGDLLILQGQAAKAFVELPAEYRLPGMKRALDHSERLALSWLRVSMTLLNSKSGFRPGFLEEFEIPIELPNSDPGSAEDPDWEQADDGKQKRKP